MYTKPAQYIALVSFTLMTGCSYKTTNEQLVCIQNYVDTIQNRKVYSEVRSAFIDSCGQWKRRGLDMSWYDIYQSQLDSAVFFNKDYSRCIMFLIQKSPKDEQYKFNNVQILGAENINHEWIFYHISYPAIGYHIKNNQNKDYSKDFLSKEGRLWIIDHGFFKPGTCKIDYSFVDSEDWFADWIRHNHQLFLEGKL